jgi:hypothetical protein
MVARRQSRYTPTGRKQASRGADAATKLPACSVLPAITGTPTEGETLSVSDGTWSKTPDAYSYQWKRNGVAIAGATEDEYELVEADVGTVITCAVKATNLGVSAVAVSDPTDEIAEAE